MAELESNKVESALCGKMEATRKEVEIGNILSIMIKKSKWLEHVSPKAQSIR